jgi:hypothetical protein
MISKGNIAGITLRNTITVIYCLDKAAATHYVNKGLWLCRMYERLVAKGIRISWIHRLRRVIRLLAESGRWVRSVSTGCWSHCSGIRHGRGSIAIGSTVASLGSPVTLRRTVVLGWRGTVVLRRGAIALRSTVARGKRCTSRWWRRRSGRGCRYWCPTISAVDTVYGRVKAALAAGRASHRRIVATVWIRMNRHGSTMIRSVHIFVRRCRSGSLRDREHRQGRKRFQTIGAWCRGRCVAVEGCIASECI